MDVAILLQELVLVRDLLFVLIELRVLQSPVVSRRGRERCARRSVRRLMSENTETEAGAKRQTRCERFRYNLGRKANRTIGEPEAQDRCFSDSLNQSQRC
jgi:hypothetical protein